MEYIFLIQIILITCWVFNIIYYKNNIINTFSHIFKIGAFCRIKPIQFYI